MKNLLNLILRYRQIIFLFFIGVILIIYISLGFLFIQQGQIQREFQTQTDRLNIILSNPLASSEQLQADYEAVNKKLVPISATKSIEMLVMLAKENGIDTDKDAGKLRIPPATISTTTLGNKAYQLVSFNNILAQGNNENVLAFISALDSGELIETLVLTGISFSEVEVIASGAEGNRRAEFRKVVLAVKNMMDDNDLETIPNPISFNRGVASSFMGDNASTSTVEGFPDTSTLPFAKGYTGTGTPKSGYLLYEHDKISSVDTTQYDAVNYLLSLYTKYYYTCEADGTVKQWDQPDITKAIEYKDSQEYDLELVAILDITIYTNPGQ